MDFIKKSVRYLIFLLFGWISLGAQLESPQSSKSIDYEPLAVLITEQYIKDVYNDFGFKCIKSGGSMPHDIEDLTIGFVVYRKVTIEEARELEVLLVEKFLKSINSFEKIHPYLREYPFTNDRACISLSFYDKKKGPQPEGVSYIFNVRNTIHYYANDPINDSKIEVASEPYEEAYRLVLEKLSAENRSI